MKYLYNLIIAINIVFIDETRKRPGQLSAEVSQTGLQGSAPGDKHKVVTNGFCHQLFSQGLSQEPLYPVPYNGVANFFADGKSESAERETIGSRIYNKIF